MGGLTIENNFFTLKIEKRNKIIVFDFQKVGAGGQKSGGAAALPAPPPPRSLFTACAFNLWSFFQPRNIDDHLKWLIDHGKFEVSMDSMVNRPL